MSICCSPSNIVSYHGVSSFVVSLQTECLTIVHFDLSSTSKHSDCSACWLVFPFKHSAGLQCMFIICFFFKYCVCIVKYISICFIIFIVHLLMGFDSKVQSIYHDYKGYPWKKIKKNERNHALMSKPPFTWKKWRLSSYLFILSFLLLFWKNGSKDKILTRKDELPVLLYNLLMSKLWPWMSNAQLVKDKLQWLNSRFLKETCNDRSWLKSKHIFTI